MNRTGVAGPPAWTPQQRAAVLSSFWQSGGPACPLDGAALAGTLQPGVGGCYILAVYCPGCGAREQLHSSEDPMHGRFRQWTAEERFAALQSARESGDARCPADGTALLITRGGGGTSPSLQLQCPRCGQGV